MYYERVLRDAKAAVPAREYLARRGLGDDVCRQFRLGYSLPGWETLREAARAKRFSDKDLLDAGLVIPGNQGRPNDRFVGASCFRWPTIEGVRSVSGRALWATRSPST